MLLLEETCTCMQKRSELCFYYNKWYKKQTWYLVFLDEDHNTKKKIEDKLRVFKDTVEKLFQIIVFN